MNVDKIDSATELIAASRLRRSIARKRTLWASSKLLPHRALILELRNAGASYPEISAILKRKYRLTVNHTTVLRFLKKLLVTQTGAPPLLADTPIPAPLD